jgi:hypothetical protein
MTTRAITLTARATITALLFVVARANAASDVPRFGAWKIKTQAANPMGEGGGVQVIGGEVEDVDCLKAVREQRLSPEECSRAQRQHLDALEHEVILIAYPSANLVSVPLNDYPGKPARARVDSNQPIEILTASEAVNSKTGAQTIIVNSKKLLHQMLTGKSLVVEQHRWPHEGPDFLTIDLAGFADAWHAANGKVP